MRKAVLDTLVSLVKRDLRVFFLTSDTGFHVFDEFRVKYRNQFANIGISEAAMIGMAAGMTLEGARVFVYGIAPFVTMRCFEQVRVDLCQNKLPVKIIGVGGGLTYGGAGPTHHSIEDVSVMAALPGMTVICPGDPAEAAAAVAASMKMTGPCYIRIGKSGERAVHGKPLRGFAIGRGIRVRRGRDIAVIATGNALAPADEACDLLEKRGIKAELASMHTVKPLDSGLVESLAKRFDTIVTVEEHNIVGGMGSMVAALITDRGSTVRLHRIALPDAYEARGGSDSYLRLRHGLTPDRLAERIAGIYGRKGKAR